MKKRAILILFTCILLTGCGKKDYVKETDNAVITETDSDVSKDTMENNDSSKDNDGKITYDKMNEIINKIGLENAVDYNEGIEDVLKDQIVFLCESPSGRYKAYGFISSEYGKQGILIDNIIDNESNHNYFFKKWIYSTEQPTLSESDDFYQVTFKICQDEEEGMKEINFMTYDTGTMSAEGWEKME